MHLEGCDHIAANMAISFDQNVQHILDLTSELAVTTKNSFINRRDYMEHITLFSTYFYITILAGFAVWELSNLVCTIIEHYGPVSTKSHHSRRTAGGNVGKIRVGRAELPHPAPK